MLELLYNDFGIFMAGGPGGSWWMADRKGPPRPRERLEPSPRCVAVGHSPTSVSDGAHLRSLAEESEIEPSSARGDREMRGEGPRQYGMRVRTAGFLWALLLLSSASAAGLQRQGAHSSSILSGMSTEALARSAAAARTPGATPLLSCRIPVFDRLECSGGDAGDAGIARWAPGLRLRGGAGEGVSSLTIMKPKFEGDDLAVPAADSGSTVSERMVAPLMPTTLARLEERQKKGKLSAMEADAMNLLEMERRIEKQPENKKLARLYKVFHTPP